LLGSDKNRKLNYILNCQKWPLYIYISFLKHWNPSAFFFLPLERNMLLKSFSDCLCAYIFFRVAVTTKSSLEAT
jgi:hypothetical protein